MNLKFDISLAEEYRSASQIARVLTESWVESNMFCPRCGNSRICRFENNRPVADFFCQMCQNQYELKSNGRNLGNKINDGAYDTMIRRITSNSNPDLLLMSYNPREYRINNLILVPKYFFVPDIIERRNPLAATAKRAGWVGCNILIEKIPSQGKILIIHNGNVFSREEVVDRTRISQSLETKNINSRGWLMDVLNCINQVQDNEFTLDEIYGFEGVLSQKHPDNNNVRAKIRQQLQFLRDKGHVEFLARGKYRKISQECSNDEI